MYAKSAVLTTMHVVGHSHHKQENILLMFQVVVDVITNPSNCYIFVTRTCCCISLEVEKRLSPIHAVIIEKNIKSKLKPSTVVLYLCVLFFSFCDNLVDP